MSKISQSEKDSYHMIFLMWKLRKKTENHRGKRGKNKMKSEREINHNRLLITGNKLRIARQEAGREMG